MRARSRVSRFVKGQGITACGVVELDLVSYWLRRSYIFVKLEEGWVWELLRFAARVAH